jgi:aminoglycoside 3-N-acetyltransferase I
MQTDRDIRYTCKQITPADLALFKELLRVFGEAFNEAETYQGAVPSDAYLRSLLSKQHFIAIAAIKGDGTVGGLAAYELEKFEQDRREIYIYDIAVSMGHRRKGIATALLDELRRIARERKAYVIFVQADIGDEPAIRLYESLGVKENVHHFDIPVAERE